MNTQLRKMIVDAECRHLTEGELARLADYARGMGDRLAAMRRLQAAEEEIVEAAAARFCERHAKYVSSVPDAREKVKRDMKLTLRYVAQAHVRDDMEFFKRNYAEWIGALLKSIVAPDVLVDGQECLRAEMQARMEPPDSSAFSPYLDLFIRELAA